MFSLKSTMIVLFCGCICIVLLGCDAARNTGPLQLPAGGQDAEAAVADDDGSVPVRFVNCRATLTTFQEDYFWSDGSSDGHDIGSAPLASFIVSQPVAHADRMIGILFKYAAGSAAISPPGRDDIGSEFTFQLPEEFLAGTHKTVDNSVVSHLRKAQQ
jgi:hypothetical protein